MKIMLLTAATGGGHLRASAAVEKYIQDNTSYDVVTVDALKAVGRFLDKTVCDSYRFMAKRVPAMFGRLYKQTNHESLFAGLVPKLSGAFSNLLYPAIAQYQPDVIITTHPFATEMVSDLKEDNSITAPLICILTDYGVHRAWIAPHVDAYVVASEDMVPELQTFGVDRDALLENLRLDPALPTVLFMAGSFGVANIIKLYRELADTDVKMQIIVITGRNQRLYEAFERELAGGERLPTRLIYFTDEVEKYMHASDLLVTKPNANFLKVHDMGVRLEKDGDFAGQISALLSEKEKLREMRENCQHFDKSQSIPNLLALIEDLVEEKP